MAAKKVLFVAPRFPYPALKGDQVVVWNRLRILGQRHRVTLLSFLERDPTPEQIREARRYCEELYLVRMPPWWSLASLPWRGVTRSEPLQVLYYECREFKELMQHLIRRERFDVIHGFLLRMAPYLSSYADRTLLELVDCMALNGSRRLANAPATFKPILSEELKRLAAYESDVARRFEHVTLVSELDRQFLGAPHVRVLPNGVVSAPQPKYRPTPGRVVFSGNMGYHANREAVLWFAERVWPLVKARRPDATFEILGCNPDAMIQKLERHAGIRVRGFVDDMAKELATAAVSVAPMRSGSGIQNKVLEAMAVGTPVVATPFALGGLSLPPEDLRVASEAEAFAALVLRLLDSPALAAEAGRKGWAYVKLHHSWELAARTVESIYSAISENPLRMGSFVPSLVEAPRALQAH